MNKLTDRQLETKYAKIAKFHSEFLDKFGVKLPKLRNNKGEFTRDALVLVYLALGYPNTRTVSKEELTAFVRQYYPNTNDVQQARHLGAQSGWYIAAGGRDNVVVSLHRGEYKLHTLEEPYPGFTKERRDDYSDWDELKRRYGNRCATCGSKQGERHLHWRGTKTILQRAHKDPRQPLTLENSIPQCQKCNRADKNWWIYDDKGRVIEIANPKIILRCEETVQKEMYGILFRKFAGRNPRELK